MTFILGLTGSIGMGKSTTAQMFVDEGCALWDADAAVHRLYGPGGAAVAPLGLIWPEVVEDGNVSREALKKVIAADPEALKRIEGIVHPLVAEDRRAFLAETQADIVVLDIPLLFEGGSERSMDALVVVSVAPEVQKARVLARGTMTEAQFEMIRAKQMPDAEKRARADYVVTTDTMDHARAQVRQIVSEIRSKVKDA
ncbi:Dephospho-CoA kinase [Pseudooceanicola marinus]|uniref:Dephospho-CoA kinase n=1 Tax=Pseudooceanicola marinus TaxID=396013 RepID=A0A1X7A0Z7_9RHOB|nr:dephospho-CoA kinase [Pseudooceanicola marinus]PJE31299.1 dephospho-CoA kinase [Pseudooceanicola marinus]SLN67598.1 Dephospho-CoA kinase [Pseudooceanicola marinus]